MEELSALINRLEDIGASNEELYDTDVKEQMNQALIEILINENVHYQVPTSFGMFSKESDKELQEVFIQFQMDLRNKGIHYNKKFELLSPSGITTKNGQIAECFFGEVTEDSLSDRAKVRKYSWIQYDWVYYLFLIVPGAVLLSIIYITSSSKINGLWFIPILVVVMIISFIIGDKSWQFCANKTFRSNKST